ncbi:hypothetical protein [Halocola ammonii]
MRLFLILIATLSLMACQKAEDKIIGKWKAVSYFENGEKTDLNHFLEFKTKGIVIISENGFTKRENGIMRYRIENDSIYITRKEVILDGVSVEKDSMKIEFKNDSLILSNQHNGVSTWIRAESISR